jgi:PKD repeat protein
VQFLYLANAGTDPELGMAGQDYLDAWLATGMAEPHLMATATWVPTTPVNVLPTASFTFACTDLSCDFDASASNDPDGSIVSYAWDFGDGTGDTGVTPATKTYAAAGTYTVTLTVTDDQNDTGTLSQGVTVTVGNQSPTALIAPITCVDLTCDFDGSGSSDPDGTIVSYAWDFGDGGIGAGAIVQYVYAAAGTYTVTLTVTDDRGATALATQVVTVTAAVVNQPPVASFTFSCPDLTCSFDGTGSTDDGTIASYAWNFGDGASGTGVTTSHTYAAAGTYTVTLTVTDDGGLTGAASQNVTASAGIPGPGPGPRRR